MLFTRSALLFAGALVSSFAFAGTPVVTTAPDAESFVGEAFCFDAAFTNSDAGEVGYSPYYRIVLLEDYLLSSATFLGGALGVTNEGTFPAAPGNTLIDSVSGDTVTGPEGAGLFTVEYPVGSVTAGSPPLAMTLCVDVDANATIDVLQSGAISITPGFALGNSATGANGPQVGGASSFDHTPKVVTYVLDTATPEGERPPGPAWTWDIEACANIAADRVVAPIDFNTVDPIVLPNNVQFVGPVSFSGAGLNCVANTTPADLTGAPGGSIDLNCDSAQGIIGSDKEICASFPVYITDTLNPTTCGTDSAVNQAEHVSIQKGSSGGRRPGTVRNYSANIQVSEFVPGVSRLEITDVFPDGLTFNDDASVDFGSGVVALTGALRTISNNLPGAGQTTVLFFVSNATGALPAAASGTISYSATIDESYSLTGTPVLARDELVNALTGDYDIAGAGNATSCSDTSQAAFTIEDVIIQKTLESPGSGIVEPGDAVTFRLRMEIPSGDVDQIVFEDFFPFPVFDATLIDTNTNLGANADITLTVNDTLGLTPNSIVTDGANNKLTINWPNVSTTAPQVIEADVTTTVSNDPFADNLALSNLFQAMTDNTPVDNDSDLTLTPVMVRSPDLEIAKTVTSAASGLQPADTVTYEIAVTNLSTAEAYDVVVSDDAPAGLTGCALDSVSGGSGAGGDSPFDGDGFAFTSFSAPTPNALDGGATATLTVSCTVDVSVTPSQTITNTASAIWASDVGAIPFTAVEVSADVTTAGPQTPVKSIVATSESATPESSPRPLAQGEVVRFRMSAAIPEGSLTNVRLIDLMPNGLRFLDDGTATIAFVSTATGAITAAGFSQASCLSGTLEQTGALAGITPSCVLPAFGGTFNSGTNVSLNIGDVVSNETDGDDEYVLIELNAVALGDQANGSTNSNRFRLQSNEINVQSATVPVAHVLPEIDVTKGASPSSVDAGDTVTYTITVQHAGTSAADAFDLIFTDTLDGANLDNFAFVGGPAAPSGETCTAAGAIVDTSDPFGAGISITFAALPLGEVCEISYSADASASVVPGSDVVNTADVAYDTLAGSGDPGNTTGSPQGAQGSFSADDQATVAIQSTVNSKRTDSTSFSHTSDAPGGATAGDARPVSIGEIVRYRLEIRLPESNAPAFTITDLMPAGLQYQTGTARLAFLAEGAGIVATPAISCSNGGTLNFIGDETNLAATEPECQIAASGGPFASGTDPVFALGGLMNDDMDADEEYVILEFDARVLNATVNQQTTDLDNTFDLTIGGTSVGSTTTAFIEVVEPQLSCALVANPNPVDNLVTPNASVSFTYTLTNAGLATAFQAGAPGATPFVIDLPAGLESITALSVTPTGNVFLNNTSTTVAAGNFSVGGTDNRVLTASSTLQFDPAASLAIEFDANLQAGVLPGDTLGDTCVVAYRSQASGGPADGYRDDSDLAGGSGNDPITGTAALNDYRDEASLTLNTIPEEPEIGLAKAITTGPVNNGDGSYSLTYTLIVGNSGNVGLDNVQIADDLATTFSGATFVVDDVNVSSDSNTLAENAGFTGSAPNANLLDGAGSTLPVGESGTVTVDVTITPGATLGPYNNSATADGQSDRSGAAVNDASHNGSVADGDGDGDPTNDSDVTPVTFSEAPQIGLAKELTGAPANNGDGTYSIQYRFIVENTGDVVLDQLQVGDDLAAVFAGAASFSVSGVSSGDFSVNFPGFTGTPPDSDLLSGTDSLAAGASGALLVDVVVEPAGNLGPYDNSATASGQSPAGTDVNDVSDNGAVSDGDGDGNPNDDSDVTPVSFVEGPLLGVAKQLTGGAVNNGDGTYSLTYTFVLENAGDISLGSLSIIEPLSTTFGAASGFSVDGLSSSDFAVNFPGFDGTPGSDELLAAGNSLAVGATGSVVLTMTLTPGPNLGPYDNSVTATGTSPANVVVNDISHDGADPDGDNDSDPTNDDDPTPVLLSETPVIGLAKSIVGSPANNADGSYTLAYRFNVENSGDVNLANVQATDALGFVFSGAVFRVDDLVSSDFAVNFPGFDGVGDANLLAAGSTLAAGASGSVDLTLTVTPGANLGPYGNTANASGTSPAGATPSDVSDDGVTADGDGNGDPTNDSDPTEIVFNENPEIGLAKVVSSGPVNLGDGSYRLGYTFVVENSGDVDLVDVVVGEPLATTFAGAGYTIDSLSSPDFSVNAAGFDGDADPQLLQAGNTLAAGASGIIELTLTLTPGAALGPYDNIANASGTSPAGTAVDDDSHDGSVPDGNGNGDPADDSDPTTVTFAENPVIAAAKTAGVATPNYDNTFTSSVTIVVANTGDIALSDVQVAEPLAGNFAPALVAAVDNLSVSGDLTAVNSAFDGVSDTSLLSGSETLAVGAGATISFDVTFNIFDGTQCVAGPLTNVATASASSPAGTSVSDQSQDGADPDPDGDADPGNNSDGTDMAFTTGVDGQLTVPAEVLPGDALMVSLNDSDQNRDSAVAETLTVTVQNLTNGENETLTLTETGPASGVFEGSLATIQGTAAGGNDDGQFTVVFDDQYRVVYNDTLTEAGCISDFTSDGRVSGFATLTGSAWIDADTDDQLGGGETPLEGWLIEVRDGTGNVVGTADVAADGSYSVADLFPGEDFTVTLVHPDSGTVFGVIEAIDLPPDTTVLDQNLPIDPSGVFYDAVSREPLAGVTVRLVDGNGAPLPDVCLLAGQQAQISASDGLYRFDLVPNADPACPSGGTYFIEMDVPGDYQAGFSELIPPLADPFDPTGLGNPVRIGDTADAPTGAESTDYYTGFTLALGDPDVVFNHIPLDPLGVETSSVRLTKRVARPTTTVGSLVAYTITIENMSPVTLPSVTVEDSLPAGFGYADGSARLDGQADGFTVSGPRPLRFEGIRLAPGELRAIRYLLRVGAGVTQGRYPNTAAPFLNGLPIGNDDRAEVDVIADPDFEETTVIGKVWHDRDRDGWQDSADATGLKISGGPFGEGRSLTDIAGRRSDGDNLAQHEIVLTLPYSDAPLTLTSAEGTLLTLAADGEIRREPDGDVERGLNAQDLIIVRERLAGEARLAERTIKQVRSITLDEVVEPVRFESGKAAIPEDHIERLGTVLRGLADKRKVRLSFVGHTDNERLGKSTASIYGDNQGLSESRARTVADFVGQALGLDADEIESSGRGASQPVASNATAEGKAINRRVEINVIYDDETVEQIVEQVEEAAEPGSEMTVRIVNRGISEEGIAGVRLATAEGLLIETDAQGRYHIAAVDGGFMERGRNYIVKVDPATLPDGSEFTTENPRVRRITQGLLNQFDFGVRMPDLADDADNRFRVGLPGGGVIWASEDASAIVPRLAVAAPEHVALDSSGRLSNSVTFVAYSNYGAFIDDLALVVFRESDSDRVRPLAQLEPRSGPRAFSDFVYFDWQPKSLRVATDERLVYVLYARDAQGRLDETSPGFLQPLSAEHFNELDGKARERWRKANTESGSAPITLEGVATLPPHVAHAMLARTYGRSQLVRQNILLYGARVRLQGHDIDPSFALYVDRHLVPVDLDGRFAAEYLLPVGAYRAQVAIGSDDTGVWLKDIPVEVTGEYSFLLALADFTASSNDLSGSVEPLSGNERYAEDTLVEGRLAYYLKAKIKGKYLLTSQLDSREEQLDDLLGSLDEKDPRSLFRRLDPDRYYPVYGDDSTTQSDTDSLGRLYVRLEWDKSHVTWGNYQTSIDGNEFIQYRRSLYGAQAVWRSVETTSRDETRTQLNVFGSESQTALGHSEFLGTGGSLYYLRHLDVIPGSDQARIEIRDNDTNRTVEAITLLRGRDYEIDELQGRIILGRPLLQIAQQSAPSVVRDGPLDGNLAVLIVDYEYLPAGFDTDQVAAGARGKHWFGDHVALGGTWISEGRGGEDYGLGGVDLTVAAGNGTYLKVEAARSEATQAERLFSTDGGLSFVQLNPSGQADRQGDAVGVEARVNLQELGISDRQTTAAAWWRRTDDQFSIARRDEGVDVYEAGAEVRSELGERTTLSLRASRVERETQLEESTYALQLDQRVGENGTLSAEARWLSQTRPETGEDLDAALAGVRYSHELNDRTRVYASGQATLDNDDGDYDNNDMLSAGVTFGVSNRTALTAEANTGHRGDSTTLTVEHDVSGNHTLYGALTHSTDSADSPASAAPGAQDSGFAQDQLLPGNTLALGHRSRISDQLDVFSEMTLADFRGPVSLGHVFGLNWGTAGGFSLGGTIQHSDVNAGTGIVERDAFTLSGGFRSARVNWMSRLEYRDDASADGASDLEQWASINRLGMKLSESFRLLSKFNYADTGDASDPRGDAKLVEGSVGFAYRPLDDNLLNWLAKYTYLYDLTSAAQLDQFGQPNSQTDQRSHIVSIEGIKRMGRRWSLGGKLARRESELRVDRSTGGWFDSATDFAALRTRYHMVRNWDAMAEYRWLRVDEADSERSGWLLSVDRHIGEHMKVGVGYNFTDFSDDLTNLDYEYEGFFLNVLGKY